MRKGLLALPVSVLIGFGATTLPSIAADYPERSVRVIVPSAPGGSPDFGARIIAGELTKQMGKQFVVDNRPTAKVP